MTIRPIIRYPDPCLRLACKPVVTFNATLSDLAQDLLETMRAAPGIGITAPHIGMLQRLTVIETDQASGVRIYVNPVLTWSSSTLVSHPEGSVSMPGIVEDVERPDSVHFAYQTLQGETREEKADGLLAVCIQHEIDQLDGIFWLQRLSRLKRDRAIKRFEKLQRAG